MMRNESYRHYRDDSCETVADALESREEFAGWTVNRMKRDIRPGALPDIDDPYTIRNAEGKHMTWISREELVLLDSTELLTGYISGNAKRNVITERVDRRHSVFMLLGLIPFLIFSFITIFSLELLPSAILNFLAGLVYFTPVYISWRLRNRALIDADKSSAKANPYFREAIQRFATFAKNHPMMEHERYIVRHEALEKALLDQ